MAETPSTMVSLGTQAANFVLPDTVTGRTMDLEQLQSDKATVIMFICNHCPFVKHVQRELVNIANEYQPKNVAFVAISSNDVERYPADSPEKMQQVAAELQYAFPYLYDESQDVARAYHAVCTPDIFVYDRDLRLVYRGQLDDSRPGNDIPVTGKDLREALDAILAGKPVNPEQKPSIGCNIKWK